MMPQAAFAIAQQVRQWVDFDQMTAQKKQQVFDQAILVFSRDVVEEGRVSKYKDLDVEIQPQLRQIGLGPSLNIDAKSYLCS